MTEIRKAIKPLKNGKAAGPDDIPAETIKADMDTAVNILHGLFSKIWKEGKAPAEWKAGIIIKLPKKDLGDCSNYRGIMLLSVPGKVLNWIILQKMKDTMDTLLRDQQSGFRRNRSCAYQIATLRIIVEQSSEWNTPTYVNFIDYEKAFDSVDRETLWKLFFTLWSAQQNYPADPVQIFLYEQQSTSCRPTIRGIKGSKREVPRGVRNSKVRRQDKFRRDWSRH